MKRGDFKIEETTNMNERNNDILSPMLAMTEAEAAVFTIKGRDSAVGATLERAAGWIWGKNSGRQTGSVAAWDWNGTMLSGKINIANGGRIVGMIICNKEANSFFRGEAT